MTTFQINQKVTVSAENGTVVGIEAGKRGHSLITVKFENGSTKKVDSRWVERPVEFAPPCSAEEFFKPLPSSAQALRTKINR